MKQELVDFKEKILKEQLSKTDMYWLDQVDFRTNKEKELNLFVNSEFVKSSIEKRLYKKIKSVYKDVSGSEDCVFILDRKLKNENSFTPSAAEPSEERSVDGKVKKDKPVPNLSVFNDLLVGVPNNLAVTAAKNVVLDPGKRFNPLFIHGEPGVGKTHLLKTMEESCFSSYYIDSESFLESYVSGIKNQDIDLFKNKIRSVDVLLIDDIQFFVGKKGVSEELFHTINYFLNNEKAVVLVSDQKPQSLLGFPERLISRVLNGLVTDIGKPDKKMFEEMLKLKNESFKDVLLTKGEILELVEVEVDSFRDINGIINNLVINKQTGLGNSEYIKNILGDSKKNLVSFLTPEFILDYVSGVYQVDKKLIVSKNRSAGVAEARNLCVALLRKHTELSLVQIGIFLGGRSHSTVLSCLKRSKESTLLLKEMNIFDNKINLVGSS
ncbi:MAG: AAA family ATPase [Candidatus Actinomarinales bacterium]|nr:MAG: AAA family ATPase [Candidatus Actinomarinales bacterium]